MSKFGETLKELIEENNLDYKTFAAKIGLSASCVTDYMLRDAVPDIDNLTAIADFFNCSTDYLLGREDDNGNLTFKKRPLFSEQLKYLMEFFGCKPSDLYGSGVISKSRFFDWKSGKRQPTVENIVKLADYFDRRIDFILGRES